MGTDETELLGTRRLGSGSRTVRRRGTGQAGAGPPPIRQPGALSPAGPGCLGGEAVGVVAELRAVSQAIGLRQVNPEKRAKSLSFECSTA